MKSTPLTLALGAALAVGLAGAGLLRAGEPALLGYAGGELWGHVWTQWWHGQALPAWPVGTDLAEGAARWPVIDPLTTLLASAAGRVLGGLAAWNLTLLGGVALAWLGGAALARQEGGSPWVGGFVLACGPVFLGSLASGLTEDAALGLLPLAWAALRDGRPRRVALGGALLGLSAACGLYLGYLGGLVALLLGLDALRREPRAWGRWLAAGALALGLGLLVALGQGERLGGEGHRAGALVRGFEPAWVLNPWAGADLASFFALGPAQPPAGAMMRLHPVALGVLPLGLALLGGRSVWWAVLLGAAALSTGLELRWRGEPLGVQNPLVAAFHTLPFAGLLNHHARLMLAGQVALAVLAARGAARRLPPWAQGLAGLGVALELMLASPAPLPLPLAPAAIDPLWSQLPAVPGAVLVAPPAGPGVPFQRPLYDQRAHGRPLLLSPNRPGLPAALQDDPLARWLGALAFQRLRGPELQWGGLQEAGVGVIVVHGPWVESARAVLGPPAQETPGGAAWVVPPRQACGSAQQGPQ